MLSVVALPVFAEDNVGGGGSGSHRGSAGSANVAQAIENTWTSAKTQVTAVVDNVVFPVVDMILAVLFLSRSQQRIWSIGNTVSSILPHRRYCLPALSFR